MFRLISDFIEQWKYESISTLKLFKSIPIDKVDFKPMEYGRSLKELAWHLTESLTMLKMAGANINSPEFTEVAPDNFNDIISFYEDISKQIYSEISKWNDNILLETHDFYGEEWKKGSTLYTTITHQTHHRAQMTVLMRQLGIIVPGIYGPSKEEWELYKSEKK